MLKRICRLVLPLAVLIAALGVYRLAVGSVARPQLPQLRETPNKIAPRRNEPLVASDEELQKILARVTPPPKPFVTNNMVHALRLWGAEAKFNDPNIPSGTELRDYFLDDGTFRRLAGPQTLPIFARTPDGLLRARSYDDGLRARATSSHHTDDLLATLGETGTSLNTPMQLRDGEATVRELLESSLLDFHLARHEYEWSVISYARYVFPQKRFQNKYGETITVDDMVDELITPPCGIGPCNGLHRLEALVVLYRADEEAHALSSTTKRKMLMHMKKVSDLLVQSQALDGHWNRHWPQGSAGQTDDKATVYDKLLVTGHHLEWLALAPDEVLPPRENIIRAARWTVKTIQEISDADLKEKYGPFSHAARALCLWRGQEAGEVVSTDNRSDQSTNGK
jgi:hypothetical protein